MVACKFEALFLLFVTSVNPSQTGRDVYPPEALRIAPPPMTFDDINPKCWNFTYGNYQKMEFYSPGFPMKYTNDTDCVLYLEAPKNFIIQLDFRETFKIEKSENCKYDFLEVRDGPFAYSPLIHRYCGETFPPLVTSSSRHLWLRFKSDDLIQDDGFKAIYSYIKMSTQNDRSSSALPPAPVCRHYLEVPSSRPDGILSSAQFGRETSYQVPRSFDCTWEIHTDTSHGIYVRSYNLSMQRPQRCDENYVALYKRTTLDNTKYVQHCAGGQLEMKTRENRVFIRMYGKTPAFRPELNLIYTIYKKDVKCSTKQFSCAGMCFAKSLLCNGVPNCPEQQDEDNCAQNSMPSKLSSIPLHTIVAGIVGGIVFTAVVIGICIYCHYKRRASERRKDDLHDLKLKQKKALEGALSSSATTTHSLTRAQGSSPCQHHPQLSPKSKDNPHRYSLGSSVQQSSDGDQTDTLTDIGNYKRFISLETGHDEESSPCPSLYNQSGALGDRYPALDSQQYPRFAANVWRNDEHTHYPYTSLKKNGQFSASKPYSYSPENRYIHAVPSLKFSKSDTTEQ